MNRNELTALRDAIDTLLTWPDNVRAEVARWLAPNAVAANPAPKPNGIDRDPPPIALTSTAQRDAKLRQKRDFGAVSPDPPAIASEKVTETGGFSPRRSPAPYAGKARRGKPSAKTAERKLLEAMRETPGLSVAALANAAASSRSRTGERLRQLAARGAVEKDNAGRWRLKAETESRPMTAPPLS